MRVSALPDAESLLLQLPLWLVYYNDLHLHRALGYRSPCEFIARSTQDAPPGFWQAIILAAIILFYYLPKLDPNLGCQRVLTSCLESDKDVKFSSLFGARAEIRGCLRIFHLPRRVARNGP